MGDHDLEALGTKIKRILKERGLSQASFSELSGIKTAYLCRLLGSKRRFTIHAVQASARALDLDVPELLAGTEESFQFSEDAIEDDRAQLEELGQRYGEAVAALEAERAARRAAEARADQADKDVAALQKQVSELQGRAASASSAASRAKHESSKLGARVERLEGRTQSQQRRLEEQQDVIAQLKQRLTKAHQDNVELTTRLKRAAAVVKRSRSAKGKAAGDMLGAALMGGLLGMGLSSGRR